MWRSGNQTGLDANMEFRGGTSPRICCQNLRKSRVTVTATPELNDGNLQDRREGLHILGSDGANSWHRNQVATGAGCTQSLGILTTAGHCTHSNCPMAWEAVRGVRLGRPKGAALGTNRPRRSGHNQGQSLTSGNKGAEFPTQTFPATLRC